MSTASDDEYAAYNFSEFTEDDFKSVDANIARLTQGGPQVTIELPAEPTPRVAVSRTLSTSSSRIKGKHKAGAVDNKSPLEQHRRRGVLSVTDLTALAWCEVQFDYGLRQRRSMPLAWRPASFTSAQGKEIFVAKEVAIRNDVRTKHGKALHKALEREVKAEELLVEPSSEEEIWALRLVNMLTSLRGILLEGFTHSLTIMGKRELPVFGILHGEVVTGIIDEVVLVTSEASTTPQKRANDASFSPNKRTSKKARRSPSQHLVAEYFSGSSAAPTSVESDALAASCTEHPLIPQVANNHGPQRFLHLIDTKTRKSNTLPEDKDTLPSRLQLMLYYRLLREISSISTPFNFAALWQHVGVDPSASFSIKFLVQAGLAEQSDMGSMSCLNDLVNVYIEAVLALNIADVDPNLELVYRLRTSVKSARGKGLRATYKKRTASLDISQEERDLMKAIEASLRDQHASKEPAVKGSITKNIAQPLPAAGVPANVESPTPIVVNIQQMAMGGGISAEEESSFTKNSTPDMSPIGRKGFRYDARFLDDHIVHVLKWWRGERSPQGVALQDSWRCRTCEYERGCEWREQKALEAQENLQGCR